MAYNTIVGTPGSTHREPPLGSCRERRTALRLKVSVPVVTRVSAIPDATVDLKDVSTGGCLIEGPGPLPVGTHHRLTIQTADGWTAEIDACVAHWRRLTGSGQPPRFAVGFTFVPTSAQRTQHAVDQLIDHLTCVLSFD